MQKINSRRICILIISCLCLNVLEAQKLNQAYLNYIDKYAHIAVAEQKKHGIPASITLAQGLLESGAGLSELAVKSNNHFGIKCHNTWTGQTYYRDDNRKNECFRKYRKVEDSYEDHSQFLLRPRYESLFKLKPTDYRGWAHGLKKAGYATDPKYADKLIKLIEDYNLHRFDTGDEKKSSGRKAAKSSSTSTVAAALQHEEPKQEASATPENTLAVDTRTKKSSGRKAAKSSATSTVAASLQQEEPKQEASTVPENTLTIDTSTKPTAAESSEKPSGTQAAKSSSMGTVAASFQHEVNKRNGVKYVIVSAGESFEDLAMEFGVPANRLMRYNDVSQDVAFGGGEHVYLQTKKNKAGKANPTHKVRPNETMHDIAQLYGIKLKKLCALNDMPHHAPPFEGQILRLR